MPSAAGKRQKNSLEKTPEAWKLGGTGSHMTMGRGTSGNRLGYGVKVETRWQQARGSDVGMRGV